MDGTVKIWSPGSSAVEVINPTPEFKYPEEDAPPAGGGRHSYRQQVCVFVGVVVLLVIRLLIECLQLTLSTSKVDAVGGRAAQPSVMRIQRASATAFASVAF
jgi:hypothetical protein